MWYKCSIAKAVSSKEKLFLSVLNFSSIQKGRCHVGQANLGIQTLVQGKE